MYDIFTNYTYYDDITEEEKKQIRREMYYALFLSRFNFSTYHSDFIKKHNLEVIKCVSVKNIDLAIVKNKKTNMQGVFSYSQYENKLILPIKFDFIDFKGNDGFIVKVKNLCGLYSYLGKRILPIKFDNLSLSCHLVIVEKNKLKGLFSLETLNWIFSITYDDFHIITQDDKLVVVSKNKLDGLYSLSLSKFVINFLHNLICVRKNDIYAENYCTLTEKAREFYYDFNGNLLSTKEKEVRMSPEELEAYNLSTYLESLNMGW